MRFAAWTVFLPAILWAAAALGDVVIGAMGPAGADVVYGLGWDRELVELDRAAERFRTGDDAGCLEALEAAARVDPELPPPPIMLARMFLEAGRDREGRAALERAVVAHPGHPEGPLVFGYLALREGRLSDAALQFREASSLVEAGRWGASLRRRYDRRCRAGLAAVAEGRGDWATAREELTAWLALDPVDGEVRQRLAVALFMLGEESAAYEALQRARRDDPRLEAAAVSMGRLCGRKGDDAKAEEWMRTALREAPEDPATHAAVASWLFQRGAVERAEAEAEAAARLAPESPRVRLLRGVIARHRKDYVLAVRELEAATAAAPDDFEARNQLALALADRGDPEGAERSLELAEANASRSPGSAEAMATLGWALERNGRRDEAERALRAAVAVGQASSETTYHLARVLAERGRPDAVRPLLEAALAASGPFAFRDEAREWLARLGR